ncbi:MAG: LamG-like jellyroll fold domain-containing protein [Blastocatellia bacterium]
MLHVHKIILSLALLAILGLALTVPAYADNITLFNTGATAEGSVDPHYTLIQSADPAYPGPNAFVVLSTGYPLPSPWIPNSATSKWIAPQANQSGGGASGLYIFRTTFDLTGLNPSTAMITGQWTTDNNGVDIRINGVSTGFITPFEAFSQGFFPFTINSGFVAGINTLDFVVNNGGLPIGLRVEMSGTAASTGGACVPPPPNLVSWYPGDGNANDIAGGRHGTLVNGATFGSGLVAQAFSFNGASWVGVPDDPIWTLGASDFTIDLWVNFNGLSGRDPFISHDDGSGEQNKWIFWYDAAGHDKLGGIPALRFHINSPHPSPVPFPHDTVVAPWNPMLGRWYHVAVTRSGNTYMLYIDGSQAATDTSAFSIPDPGVPLTIGRAEGFTLNGSVDEVEIHSRALSAQEIFQIFTAGSAGKCKTGTGADLAITKVVAPNPVLAGSNVTYTITVTNNGPGAAANVTVTDNLPASTTFVSCSATGGGVCGGSGNNRTVTFTSLAAGASATITLVANVNCSLANGAAISNTATVSSSTPDPVADNNSATANVTASNPPPVITNASANPSVLWPPNHRMVDVTVNHSGTDNCGSPSCTLSVSSNEPINGTGDGDTAPDWEIIDAHHVRLRAERAGNGNGRVYTITITCRDSAGNSSSRSVTVRVPISQGRN